MVILNIHKKSETNSGMRQGRNFSDNWGGGGVYSYIRVMPSSFLLKSTQIQRKSVGRTSTYKYTHPQLAF